MPQNPHNWLEIMMASFRAENKKTVHNEDRSDSSVFCLIAPNSAYSWNWTWALDEVYNQ